MIDQDTLKFLMKESIEEARKCKPEDKRSHPKVGAVLADEQGNIIQKAHRNEGGNGEHAEFMCIRKAREADQNIKNSILFATLEPCTARKGWKKKPCADHIIESGVKKVYIGMTDPDIDICGKGETLLKYHHIEVVRYFEDLAKEVESLNKDFFESHRDSHLSAHSLYIQKQINAIMTAYLVAKGFALSDKLPIDTDLTIADLASICESVKPHDATTTESVHALLREARAKAFDMKYSDRTYEDDTRGIGDHWQEAVRSILSDMRAGAYRERKTLVVGIGNGEEGKELYAGCSHLTAVDIGEQSLKKASGILTKARILQADAENLDMIPSGSQDIYVSLRTYQSTYFGRNAALLEAHRVVRQGGIAVISVANGFLDRGTIIPGLLIPGTRIVDRNLGFRIADQIRSKISVLRFDEIGVRTTFDEIFVYGRRGR